MRSISFIPGAFAGMALVAGVLCAAPAAQAGVHDLQISGQWIRMVVPVRPAAGYFTLKNTGDADVALVGAASPGCGMAMLHQSVSQNGVDKMVPVKEVKVPAHGAVSFKPGSYHIMCMKPTDAVRPGKVVPMTLKFAGGGTITTDFPVKNAMGK